MTAAAVELRELTSGTLARVASGVYDILANDPTGRKRPCRAIACAGAITIKGLDGVSVVLPDKGEWQWDIQAIEITSGTVVVIW